MRQVASGPRESSGVVLHRGANILYLGDNVLFEDLINLTDLPCASGLLDIATTAKPKKAQTS